MVVCELRHGEHVGYGEASPSKRVTGETAESVGNLLDQLAPQVERLAPAAWESFLDRLHAEHSASPSARAALDLALHDLVGKIQEVPARALYGIPPARLETCMTVSLDAPDVMVAEAKGYHEAGFRVLKLKLGKADGDVARVEAIRAALPDAALRADANTGWSPAEARRVVPVLAKAGVEFVEQPFLPSADDELAAFSRESPLPLYADESVMDARDVERLHALGFRGGVNLKLQKTGGIRPAVAALRKARAKGYQVQLGCNVETAIGIAGGVQLLGALDHADLDGHLLLADQPFLGPMPDRGWYTTPDAPGLGVAPAPG
jgi:L-alanine-DL-glutamate epimerase-like enolase superfamily enzyme